MRFLPKRRDFAQEQKKHLKRIASQQSKSVEWWFRDRYKLAPTDPRFLDMTRNGMVLEYWTAHYASMPAASFEADDPDFDLQQAIEDLGISDDDEDWEDAPHLSTSP